MKANHREALKTAVTRAFLTGDRLGFHLQPAHYYSSVASRKDLRRREGEWRRRLDPMPFPWDLDAQLDWTRWVVGESCGMRMQDMLVGAQQVGPFRYGPVEGLFLYSAIRKLQPARLLEIGSGSTTWIASQAVQQNVADGGVPTEILACDPYTANRVAQLPYVAAKKVGGLAIGPEAAQLADGDVLFIDSTHVLRTGSELSHLYLELLPSLPSGVVVHIHDITLPYLFPPDIYESMFDWQETALVAALLAGNDHLRVLACQSALAWDRSDELRHILPEYCPRPMRDGLYVSRDGHFPSSLWLQIA